MSIILYVRNKVVRGFGRGSKELGCPTANIDDVQHLNIETGIYCGLAQLVIRQPDQVQGKSIPLPHVSKVYGMVTSFGFNPQYGNQLKSLEVHILQNFDFDFYGAELRVLLCRKTRDEMKYNSLQELKDAIANDMENARKETPNYMHHAENVEYFLKETTAKI